MVGVLAGEGQVVQRRDHGQRPGQPELVHQGQHLVLVAEVERGGRLVEEQQRGLLRQRPRDDRPLALASGQGGDRPPCKRLQAEVVHQTTRHLLVRRALDAEQRDVGRPPEQHVVGHRHPVREHRVLGHDGDGLGTAAGGEAPEVPSLELDRTLLRDDDSDEKAHQADDSERAHADDVEPLHYCIDSETARGILDDVGKADERRTEESEEPEHGHARLGDPLADLRNDPEKASAFFGMDLRGLVELGDLLEQAGLVAAGAGDLGMPIADRAIDDPCADRIHAIDLGKVDGQRIGHCVDLTLGRRRAGDGEGSRDPVNRAVRVICLLVVRVGHEARLVREMNRASK